MIEYAAGWLIIVLIILGLGVWALVGVTWLYDWWKQ